MTFSELMRGIGRGARTVGRGMMRGAVGFDDRDIRRVGQRRRGRRLREQLEEKVIPGDPAYNEMGEVDQAGIDFGDVPGLEMEQPGRMDIPGGMRMPDLAGPPDLGGEDPSIAEMRRMGAFEGEGAVRGPRRSGRGLAEAVAQVRRQGGGFNPGGEPLFDPARDGGSQAGAATPEQIAEVRGFRVPPMSDVGGRSLTETLEGMEKFPGAGITGGAPGYYGRSRDQRGADIMMSQGLVDPTKGPGVDEITQDMMSIGGNLALGYGGGKAIGAIGKLASGGKGGALQALRGMRNPGSVSAPAPGGMRGGSLASRVPVGPGRAPVGRPINPPLGEGPQQVSRDMMGGGDSLQMAFQRAGIRPRPGVTDTVVGARPAPGAPAPMMRPNAMYGPPPPARPRPGQPGVEGPQEALPPGIYESPIRRMGQRMVGMRRSM